MIYKDFADLSLSALGMGCMRLPTLEGNSDIDKKETKRLIDYAMEKGINYYDTAWGYHGGNSEGVIGECLSEYPRESFYLATKFPGYDLANMGKVVEIFAEQLRRCRVDYFDFYLIHNVCERNINEYLDPKYGTMEHLREQKKAGRIRHLGFSAHGDLDVMKRFLDAYADDMEFCQLQINWLDWEFQNANEKVELVQSYGLPIWVMEPVRGGSLAKLDDFYMSKLEALRPGVTAPEWAFRFLQSLSGVVLTLSGMSNFTQLCENIDTYESEKPLTEEEMNTLFEIGRAMTSKKILPCTSCRYCTEHCPMELDIPKLIGLYNEYNFTGGGFLAPMVISTLPEEKRPSACLGCAACEAVCPQNIKISEMMADFSKKVK